MSAMQQSGKIDSFQVNPSHEIGNVEQNGDVTNLQKSSEQLLGNKIHQMHTALGPDAFIAITTIGKKHEPQSIRVLETDHKYSVSKEKGSAKLIAMFALSNLSAKKFSDVKERLQKLIDESPDAAVQMKDLTDIWDGKAPEIKKTTFVAAPTVSASTSLAILDDLTPPEPSPNASATLPDSSAQMQTVQTEPQGNSDGVKYAYV